ncbi:glycoside hydrolase family 3 protein [Aestuariicella hydrocarbonica]|uniref:Glycoside hydrolase family 3 protein n=1 Tax=Pseudomaricurvus hydrocarbonicus TaxID=1470433 RepID=A0A9E5JWY7_9GAMM|nr:exo 1,3/1,4-beta-D-glucan glucohydrolase [Aestuariicella hydrocarbonica]NHO66445.1 glycoside hydrolase family 3 protein [Aestuariicella hydrocarbonica]
MNKYQKIGQATLALCVVMMCLQGCDSDITDEATASTVLHPPGRSQATVNAAVSGVSAVSGGAQAAEWPNVVSAVDRDAAVENRVTMLLDKLTLEEKVGQIIQPEIKFITPEQVKKYHIGSVLNGGGTAPNNNKFAPVSEWVAMADAYYTASVAGNGAGVPLIWGSDAVHGHNNVVGATLFPHNIGLGAARDKDLIHRIGEATAQEVAVTGIDWTFAPTVAVARDDRWGRTFESYSEDPEIVRGYAREMVQGLQGVGDQLLNETHVVATAKHFLGDGGTDRGIDRGDTQVSESELLTIHAAGFIAALEAGVQTVMASFNSWNGVKMHGSQYLLTDILKGKLGFDGFVVGDWNGHRQVPGCSVTSCPQAINAGLDMFMVPSDWQKLYENTLQQVRTGKISRARLDDAVSRILRVKVRAGLMDKGLVSRRSLSAKPELMGGFGHRALAREAVRKSLVLLKNNGALLPINPAQKILLAGSGANDIGKQSGGWTLSWQGTGNTREDFPGATSIFDGFRKVILEAGGKVELSLNGSYLEPPDVAVVVIGENPYAEWHGDIASIEYQYGVKEDLALLKRLKQAGIPVVTVFLSGRPLWVNKEINLSDAFVAAWLPGSEGDGVADVLVGDKQGKARYDFVGKLSFSWPKYVHQTPLNHRDPDYDPLFAYGYGLSYSDSTVMAADLPEATTLPSSGELEDAWLFVSRTLSPWGLFIASGSGDPVEATGNSHLSGDNENLSVLSVDKESQEDARKIRWLGLEQGRAYLAAKNPQDLSAFAQRNGYLQLDLQVTEAPSSSVMAAIGCGEGCEVATSLDSILREWPLGTWRSVTIDLQCFHNDRMDFSRVNVPFSLSTEGSLTVSVANVKIIPRTADPSSATRLVGSSEQVALSCSGS